MHLFSKTKLVFVYFASSLLVPGPAIPPGGPGNLLTGPSATAPHTATSVMSGMLLRSTSDAVTPLSATFQSLLIAFRIKPKFPTVA